MKLLPVVAIGAPLLALVIGITVAVCVIASSQAQTTPSESWRYDLNADGAVTIADAILLLPHVGETYQLPGPCHPFTSFATPVVVDGATLDGYFADDLSAPPSRDYLTC